MTTPSYVSLVTLNSKTVDIAALGQKVSAPVQEDSHIVKTELIYLGKDEFKKLFFSNNGENFSINHQLYDDYHNQNINSDINIKEFNDVMTFNKRFKVVDNDSNHIERLVLTEHIFSCYENDTGTDRDCWEVCCLMDIQQTLNSINCLCDMGVGCNVLSSLKWSEIENIIRNENINYDSSIEQTKTLLNSNNPTRHILQISTVFKSSSSDIKDCIIIFRYAVDMRDSTIETNKYFRFGNPEYLLSDFKIKVNQQDIDINFKSDVFNYNVEIIANNNFDIEIVPVVFPQTLFNFLEKYNRQRLNINIYWFNNKDTICPKNNLYHASTNFNELDAIIENYKKLQNRDDLVLASYANPQKSPVLRIVIKNRDDNIGDTIIIYEIHFTIKEN